MTPEASRRQVPRGAVAATAPARLAIQFPGGLPGFPGRERFVLLARPRSRPFAFLAAVGRPRVVLPVLPLDWLAAALPQARAALAALGLGPAERAWAVATVGPGGRPVTVNLRAPVVVDAARGVGAQRILEDARLPLAARLL